MLDHIEVRTVRVELLRAGPAHNQLLSPLTPYLAVCDDAEAGVVHVPWEQHSFARRMRAMRHDDLSEDAGDRPALKDRLPDLRELGVAMARLLGSVPRFPGTLSGDPNGRDTVVRVSLTLSASELAGLPFELAKVPIGPDTCTESWLSVQSKLPVVITRRTRNVSITNPQWLDEPRVLFVAAGPEYGAVPYEEHLAALMAAVKPFTLSDRFGRRARLVSTPSATGQNQRQTYGDTLTVLSNATLDGVAQECASHRYTHVHILAHGSLDSSLGDTHFGLALHPKEGVISGERLASALTGVIDGRLHRPQVVTLATCDSGNAGDPVNPGASIAHVLHQAGIPLVVASQVPLTVEASILFVELFYAGLLWGEHPWVLMHRVRSTLHGRLQPMNHDWASLVVYESLPTDLTRTLERAQYLQCRRAIAVAYVGGRWVGSELLMRAIERLADSGQTYGMEARALRADLRMINARDEIYDLDRHPHARSADERRQSVSYQRACLEQALVDYGQALAGFFVSAGQGLEAPYRAMLTQFSIRVVLGKPVDWDEWQVARLWAETTARQSPVAEARGWAHACLCELWLLRVLDPDGPGAEPCMAQAASSLRDALRSRDFDTRQSGFAGTMAYWLDNRLSGYVGAWTRPELRQHPQAEPQDEASGPVPLDTAPLIPAAESLMRLMRRLDDSLGALAETDEAAAAPAPAMAAVTAARSPKAPAAAAPAPAAKPLPGRKASGAAARPGQTLAAAATPLEAARKRATPRDPVFDIDMLPVDQGDSLWVEWGSRKGPRWRLLIDCGTEGSFKRALGPRIAALPSDPAQRRFELFILSHIDGDHIGGGIALLQQARQLGVSFGDIWFNGRRHLESRAMLSGKDGDDFTTLLLREKQPWNLWTKGRAIVRPPDTAKGPAPLPRMELPGGMVVTLLSPIPATLTQLAGTWDADLAAPGQRRVLKARQLETSEDLDALVKLPFKPDDSRPNGSSIAVLLEFAGRRALMGADAYADVLASAMRQCLVGSQTRVPLDVFKLSHHGSRGNVNDELLSLIDCPNYLISTSGAIFDHPDREALARVVRRSPRPVTLWFDYPPSEQDHAYHALWQRPDFQKRWNFHANYPDVKAGAPSPGMRFSLFPAGG